MDSEPERPLSPLHAPEAVQVSTLAALQFNVELSPLLIVLGSALKSSVGSGGGGVVTVKVCVVQLLFSSLSLTAAVLSAQT